jgi:DNA-binding Xre family transcriptional regulator
MNSIAGTSGMYNNMVMTMRNKVKDLIERHGITRYRFWKDTGLSRQIAYQIADDPNYIPSGATIETICRVYGVQPGDLLEYSPDE